MREYLNALILAVSLTSQCKKLRKIYLIKMSIVKDSSLNQEQTKFLINLANEQL